MENEQAFLMELQSHCLIEADDYLNSFREVLATFKNDPAVCIVSLQKILHSLKGNLQAVAFSSFGEYVHLLESLLDKNEKLVLERISPLSEQDVQIFELFLSNVMGEMEAYVNDLKNSGVDSNELQQKHQEPLTRLGAWTPSETNHALDGKNVVTPEQVATPIEKASVVSVVPPEASEAPTVPPEPSVAHVEAKPNIDLAIPTQTPTEPPPPASSPSHASDLSHASGLFLLFQNMSQYFAIAIEYVVEVIKTQPLSATPIPRKNLSGLLNLRGEVLPILHIPEITLMVGSKPNYVVVTKVGELRFGFQVEAVHRVIALDSQQFQTIDALSAITSGKSISHFFQAEDKTISILVMKELVGTI